MTQKWEHDTPARDAQEGELKTKADWLRPTASFYMQFPCGYQLKLYVQSRIALRRLRSLLLGPMESGSEAGFPWEKAEQRSGLHLPLAEDCSPRSL